MMCFLEASVSEIVLMPFAKLGIENRWIPYLRSVMLLKGALAQYSKSRQLNLTGFRLRYVHGYSSGSLLSFFLCWGVSGWPPAASSSPPESSSCTSRSPPPRYWEERLLCPLDRLREPEFPVVGSEGGWLAGLSECGAVV